MRQIAQHQYSIKKEIEEHNGSKKGNGQYKFPKSVGNRETSFK